MNGIGTIESKILELMRKGIRPIDIAKIYDLQRAEVQRVINDFRNAEATEKLKAGCIEKIMQICKVEEKTAEKTFLAIKEALCTK